MKRLIALVLACMLLLSACSSTSTSKKAAEAAPPVDQPNNTAEALTPDEQPLSQAPTQEIAGEQITTASSIPDIEIKGIDDEALLRYVKDNVYSSLVSELNSEEFLVEYIDAAYYPKEYIEALASNSQANRYFGYTSAELNEHFQGTKYVFTLGEDGQTIVVPMETLTDDVYVKAMENVIIGSGVILVCVTVSIVAAPAAPAVSVIFAASAATGTKFALESGALGFAAAAIAKGYETESFEQALKAGAEAGAEGFKWGAIIGAVVGGAGKAIALKGATINGLTMNEDALIQKESQYPLDVIKQFSSMEQYEICKEAGLSPRMVNGKTALVRNIDLNLVDDMGRTNLQRMQEGLAALDPSGQAYELHHIGQQADSTLAMLTKAEHMQGGNNKIWHVFGEATEVHGPGNTWDIQRQQFWIKFASSVVGG